MRGARAFDAAPPRISAGALAAAGALALLAAAVLDADRAETPPRRTSDAPETTRGPEPGLDLLDPIRAGVWLF